MKYKVKLSRRYAERLLTESNCKVIAKGFDFLGKPIKEMILETKKGSFYYEGGKTFIKTKEGVDIELKAIKKIKHQATRFSPMMIFEEVDWNE